MLRLPNRAACLALLALAALLSACKTPAVQADHVVTSELGAVACVEYQAAMVGARILLEGGNAVDAAVAMAFALAVTWPPAGNIGGGTLMLVARPGGEAVAIDGREAAPAAVGPDLFLDETGRYVPELAADPYLCTGVPGTVAALALAHREHGRLSWYRVVAPAVTLARLGFTVDATLAEWLEVVEPELAAVPASRAVFLDPFGGRTPQPGERLVQADLARTLESIAWYGPDVFYGGELGERIAADIQAHGGLLDVEDLAAYETVEREPLRLPYRGRHVLMMPPPSSALAVGQMLGVLDRRRILTTEPGSATEAHLLAEAARRAFAERAQWLGDPAFTSVPSTKLLSPAHLDELAEGIDATAATPSEQLGPPLPVTGGVDTTHLSVVDAEGWAVSLTTSLEQLCGGKAVAAGTGILLNNQLRDFNRVPGRTDATGFIGTAPNLAAPGRRPLSSMSPIIVVDKQGRPELVTGSPGGRTILNTTTQIVLGVIGRGLPLPQVVNMPRMHHAWFPDEIVLEAGADPALVADLEALGHAVVVREASPPLYGTQGCANSVAVDWTDGMQATAVGDPRRDGWAAGVVEQWTGIPFP